MDAPDFPLCQDLPHRQQRYRAVNRRSPAKPDFLALEAMSAVPEAAVGRLAPVPVALTWKVFASTTAAVTGRNALTRKI
jgi:hypothetical protein